MGKYLMMIGVCIMCAYTICNRFVWQIPNKIAIPILIVDIAMIMVGAVWGKPRKDALITLSICIAIGGIGAFLTWKFMK